MPNRLIKDTIRTSRTVSQMSDFQFRVWVYLITYVDDYGRGIADPEILLSYLFPRRNKVTKDNLTKALNDLAALGAIELYAADGEQYLAFPKWEDHQRIRNKTSKYPAPPEGGKVPNLAQLTAIRGQMTADGDTARTNAAEENPIQSNPIQSATLICTEQKSGEKSEDEIVITMQLTGGEIHGVTKTDLERYKELYPAVDIMQELRKMAGWCHDHPKRRKTRTGIRAFIGSWLAREQDRPRPEASKGPRKLTPNFEQRTDDLDSAVLQKVRERMGV